MILRRIFISPGHNFVGRHGLSPENHAMLDIERVECVAGRGLRGDRYFDHRSNFKGQVTLISAEVFLAPCAARSAPELKPSALRRNLIVEQADLNALVGQEFYYRGFDCSARNNVGHATGWIRLSAPGPKPGCRDVVVCAAVS